jgi:coenzyme PQQ precursor peptide PqqA
MNLMMVLIHPSPAGQKIGLQLQIQFNWRIAMKWETPVATEFRFGMEITMYVANR